MVEQVSEVISIHGSGDMEDLRVDPAIGNVAFGSAKGEWAFTVIKFARIYAKKFGIPADKMMNKLWGENYFYAASKKWTTQGLTAEGWVGEEGEVSQVFRVVHEGSDLLDC